MIVSYAQNFEDVMLWRALQDVENGFYIDVGAQDPRLHSVTKLFYEQGWNGVNIDPVPEWISKLKSDRPRDINLAMAAGEENTEANFYDFPGTGLSTFSKEIAERHEATGCFSANVISVRIGKLAEICKEHCNHEVHFLKIDVEGSEKEVLLGMDFKACRPWIVLVESTLPLQDLESHQEWDSILESRNYKYVYFDGLNRFYVSKEKVHDLQGHFNRPPNVFDDFELDRVIRARGEIEELKQTLTIMQELKSKAKSAEVEHLDDLMKLASSETRAKNFRNMPRLADQRATQIEARVVQTEDRGRIRQLEELGKLKVALTTVEQELHEVHQSNHNYWQLAETLAIEIQTLRSSFSWRLTAPLRLTYGDVRKFFVTVGQYVTAKKVVLFSTLTTPLKWLMTEAIGKPEFASKLNQILVRVPTAHRWLKNFAERQEINIAPDSSRETIPPRFSLYSLRQHELPREARVIMQTLISAYDSQSGGKSD
ncbi:MAG: FkbM family methyltransferase [Hyphomicrobiales bacterium]